MEKVKIADLEFNYKDALKALTALAEQIKATKAEISGLEKENEILRNAGRQDTEQYKNNAKAVETNKIALAGLQKEYKDTQTVVTSSIAAKDEEIGTIRKLEARNKELRTSLRNLNLETEAGRKQQKIYIAEINKNTETIRTNSDAYVQQKMNIGNYKSALDVLPGSMKNVANGFQMAGNAAKAFIANPVVLAIAAIVAAVTGLFKAFKNTEEGGDRLKKKFDQIKAVVDVLKDRIENFALGLAKVFSGEQKLKDLKGTFAGIGDEIKRDVQLAGQLRDMLEQLEDKEIDLIVVSSARRTEINKLREAAADQNKTEGERAALLQRAIRLIDEEVKAQKEVLLTKLANELGTTDLVKVQERLNQVREEGKQITLDELGLSNSTNEDRKRVNELIAQYIDLEGQAASQKKEMTSQISGLIKQERTEREQQIEAENEALEKYYAAQLAAAEAEMLREVELEKQKIAEKERLRLESIEKEKQWNEELAAFRAEKAFIDADNERIIREVAMNDRFQAELDALAREQEAEIQAALKTGASVSLITKKYAEIEKAIEREKQKAKLDIIGSFAGSLAQLFDEETKLGKAAAITQTVINTYKGAMAAFAETPGGVIIKSAAAATAVVAGIAAVKNIAKAGGGGGGGASIADLPGSGGVGTEVGVSPNINNINATASQPVLVLEEFQFVQGTQVKVKAAGEL